MDYRTVSQGQTEAMGRALGECLAAGDTVLLTGDLGAGKSVLARAVARSLGVEGPMPSPTFTLMQPYAGRVAVCHFDLYRLADPEEFYAVGLDEPVGRDVCLVEWPMEEIDWPAPCARVEIRRGAREDERRIRLLLTGFGTREEAVARALGEWEMDE